LRLISSFAIIRSTELTKCDDIEDIAYPRSSPKTRSEVIIEQIRVQVNMAAPRGKCQRTKSLAPAAQPGQASDAVASADWLGSFPRRPGPGALADADLVVRDGLPRMPMTLRSWWP